MSLQIRSPASQIKTLQYTHNAKVDSKNPVVIGGKVLIPLHDAALNTLAGYVYEAEISGAAKSAGAITINAPLYWDAAANSGKGAVTTAAAAGANKIIGHALEAMDTGDTTTGLIAFNAYAAA